MEFFQIYGLILQLIVESVNRTVVLVSKILLFVEVVEFVVEIVEIFFEVVVGVRCDRLENEIVFFANAVVTVKGSMGDVD